MMEYVYEKKGSMFIKFYNGEEIKVSDFLNVNEYNLQKRIGEYPADLEKIMHMEYDAEYQEGIYEIRKKELQMDLDYCEAYLAQQIRNGIIDLGYKSTEAAIKEYTMCHSDTQAVLENIKKVSKKILKARKIKNMVSCISRAFKDLKDCLVTYSANLRSENNVNTAGIEKMLKNISKGE